MVTTNREKDVHCTRMIVHVCTCTCTCAYMYMYMYKYVDIYPSKRTYMYIVERT